MKKGPLGGELRLEIRFLREWSEPLLLKIELQNQQKLDFCERSEQRSLKIEVENL